MKLRVNERGLIVNLLPKTSDFDTLRIIHDLRMKLSLSEDDYKRLNVRYSWKCDSCNNVVYAIDKPVSCTVPGCDSTNFSPTGRLTWDSKNDTPVDIEIGEIATKLIKDKLIELNNKKQLDEEMITVYEKFVMGIL